MNMALYVENDMKLACGEGCEGSQLVHYCQWWRSHNSHHAQSVPLYQRLWNKFTKVRAELAVRENCRFHRCVLSTEQPSLSLQYLN